MTGRLRLSLTNKKIAGVCGGLGEYFDVDPTLIRALWVIVSFFWGTGILIYLLAWLLMPKAYEF